MPGTAAVTGLAPGHGLHITAGGMADRLGGPRRVDGVHAQRRLPQVHRDALGDAGRHQQHLPLPVRARQHALHRRPLTAKSTAATSSAPGRLALASRKSSRLSHARCEISSSAAASVGSHPFAHARIAAARSSKQVVRRGRSLIDLNERHRSSLTLRRACFVAARELETFPYRDAYQLQPLVEPQPSQT